MRRFLLLVPFLMLPLACQSTPADVAAFKALQADMSIIGPEYKAYVTADPKFDLYTPGREQRVKLVDDMNRLLAEKVK
jgi:hypothetical protein